VRLIQAALLAAVLTGCGSGERACDLLEDVPDRADRTNVEELLDVADAAAESDLPEIRTLGGELRTIVAQRRSLEGLAPGLAVDALQTNLDAFRQTCQGLAEGG
jgi:hypothetical protein